MVERRQTAVPSIAEQRRRAENYATPEADPPRRRRMALVGGGVLVASTPVTVGAGLFVPGFAALGVGALLLLLPPRARRERAPRPRSPLRLVRLPAAAGGRATAALARGSARTGARTFSAVEHFAVTDGRDGAIRIGAAVSAGAGILGRTASAAGSRGWSRVQVDAPRAWYALVALARAIAREGRSASIWLWVRTKPLLRRAWLACRAGVIALVEQLAVMARSVSARLSAYVDSRSRPR